MERLFPSLPNVLWMMWLLCIDLAACLQLQSLCHSLCHVTVFFLFYFVLSLYNSKFFFHYDQVSRVWEMEGIFKVIAICAHNPSLNY